MATARSNVRGAEAPLVELNVNRPHVNTFMQSVFLQSIYIVEDGNCKRAAAEQKQHFWLFLVEVFS